MNGQIFLHNHGIHHTGICDFLICLRAIYGTDSDDAHTQTPIHPQ